MGASPIVHVGDLAQFLRFTARRRRWFHQGEYVSEVTDKKRPYPQRNSSIMDVTSDVMAETYQDADTVALQLHAIASDIQPFVEQVLEGLPPFLQCTSISLVVQAMRQATNVAVSQRVLDETLVLATAGLSHLLSTKHNPSMPSEFHALHSKREASQAKLQTRARRIQAKWFNARFRTLSCLPKLELSPFSLREPDPLHVKQTRFEHAQHRWEYLLQQLCRRQRQRRLTDVKATHTRHGYAQEDTDVLRSTFSPRDGGGHRRPSRLPHRDKIEDYVANILNHAVLRASWVLEMQALPHRPDLKCPLSLPPQQDHQRPLVLHVAMLLCPNLFGPHFGLLYQQYFAKHAVDANVVFEWTTVDVASLDFPTQALQRCLDGFFVCGAPDVSSANRLTSAPWYGALVDFVRALVAQDRPVGALGRGHVVLAEALGGRIDRRPTWQRAHNMLEEKVTTGFKQVQTRVRVLHTLHGEYVASMAAHPWIRTTTSMPVPGSMYAFVSSIKAPKRVLSFDGYPECSSLVFDMLSRLVDPDHSTSVLFKKASTTGGSLALDWVSAGPGVAHQFIHLFVPGAVARAKAGPCPSVLHDDDPRAVVPMAIFASKSPIPHVDFISDTDEYFSFALHEHVDSIVLGLNLSKDDHPIVFPRSCLNDMTDVADVFPALLSSKHHKHPLLVHIPRLTLVELKSLTILHAYQSRHVMKSPRVIPGSSPSSHNRLLTLCSALTRLADIHARLPPPPTKSAIVRPLHVTLIFPGEDASSFVKYSPQDLQKWWRVLNGAIAALHQPPPSKLTIVSRDATMLQVLRKMQPAWDFLFVLPPAAATVQDAVDIRRQAKVVARFADGVLLQKHHEFIACSRSMSPPVGLHVHPLSIVDLYHEVGLRVYVNANGPDAVTFLGPSSGPVREQVAFLLLGVDGVFTSNPHPVQDARKLLADRHSVVDEVRDAIRAHGRAAMAQVEADHAAESDRLTNVDGYRLYAHHYYNLPLESHEVDQWQQHTHPLQSQHSSLVLSGDTVLDYMERLHAVDVPTEAHRQLQSHATVSPVKTDNQRRDLHMAVKNPTLDQVRRGKPVKVGKRNRSVGFAFRSRHLVVNNDDESNWSQKSTPFDWRN
ncbi:hypothetical protein DYB30_001527 [Aphanomyces astaci]|uniref:GP-PDE domain-containing protein n=3 Tax=Aphanomyces astaci TaxID=112090 RepID=A0A397D186_APHAT|nr:hypothetical protein DYB30_001527 [Aphanomyces astaci]